jgi:AcrR family transcriptional regulator
MSPEITSGAKRPYELRKRAATMSATRQKITEAAVDLHGTIGPARTTISAVAAHAGVQRHTVYRHFPTEEDLYRACSGHFSSEHPAPDPAAWRAIADPAERLATGLDELYGYYEGTEAMYAHVLRDAEQLPVLDAVLEQFRSRLDDLATALATGWGVRGGRRHVVDAAARHVVDFATWQSLMRRGGLSRRQAIDLATAMVDRAVG